MHEHDLDLIADYASGLLGGEDARRAAELISTCDVCAAEASLQHEVATALRTAPQATMTDLERARLHRTVAEGISVPRGAGRERRWMALGSVAAATLVLVGGFAAVNSLVGGGTTTNPDTAISEMAEVPRLTAEGTEGLPNDDLGAGDAATGVAAAEAGNAVAGGTEAARLAEEWLVDARALSPGTVSDILSDLRTAVSDPAAGVSPDEAEAFGAACAAEVQDPILALVLVTIDGSDHEVYLTADHLHPVVSAFRSADCAPVDAEGLLSGR